MRLTNVQIHALKAEHEPAILAMLDRWRHALRASGFSVSEPYEMHDQDRRWDLAISREGEDDFVDLSVALTDSRHWDGNADDDGSSEGITVISGIVTTRGRILTGFAPFNYSERVWTDDANELRDRVSSLIQVDPATIVEFVSKVLANKLHCDR